MYAVLEEINDNIARFVPDSKDEAVYLSIEKIPEPYEIGDVFFVEKRTESSVYLKKVDKEKKRRLQSNYIKRQKLLDRSNKNKSEKY
ncbi:hypothetical protein [Alkalibacterium kapii]|uniref:DUF3006 domain-containing protein n=1 Tax=Alkalibacterium kapii TaxID=426704 RepID=A0A511AV81_9LACT|nr:hypothetical protein [Alkalibacterium kapii]GEK92056.1 hypothetical protein AKA01nite_16780 [Alkalibacterium kapii]